MTPAISTATVTEPGQPRPDGIYFDMDPDDYFAEPRLSASGIRDILTSPATFWANSWMNPNREDDDTEARIIGRAYHCARLEPDKLEERFVPELDKAAYEGEIVTDSDIRDVLEEIGEPQSKKGELVRDRAMRLATRLKEIGSGGRIWYCDLAAWEEERGDRQPIPADQWAKITTDMQRIRQTPEVAALLTGGAAEVSVFWTDPDFGTPMKARLDYLAPKHFVDFKTFENRRGKPLEKCIVDAIMYGRYHVQIMLYWRVVEMIRAGALDISGTDAQCDLIDAIVKSETPAEPWFIFQEKGGVPNLLARRFVVHKLSAASRAKNSTSDEEDARLQALTQQQTLIAERANLEIRNAIKTFNQCLEIWPDRPWGALYPRGVLDDASFPLFFLES